MANNENQKLIELLKDFVTPERYSKFINVLENRTRHLTVVLEDIFQTHNASAVLRSCECFGVQDVHVIENSYSFEVNPDIVLGSNKWLSIYRYNKQKNNTSECLKTLKKKGYTIVATSPNAEGFAPFDIPIDKQLALVFGTEFEGLSIEATNAAEKFLQIPMFGFTESFNISVSAAICLYQITQKIRMSNNINWRLSDSEMETLLLEWLKKSIKNPELLIQRFQDIDLTVK